jgi:flagellin
VQAMNATVGDEDKSSLNQEFQALSAEIQRNAATTKFNGVQVIGTDTVLTFQIGYEQGSTAKIGVSTQDMRTASGLTDIFGGGAATSTTVTSTTTSFGAYTSYTFSGTFVTASANVVTSAGAGYTSYTVATSTSGGVHRTASGAATVAGSTASTVVTSATASTTAGAGTISTLAGASAMLAAVDTALDKVSQIRADFGAAQNRLESTVRNNANIVENQSSARSRIMDADFASETANLTRAQILQQAGVAMLAQANALPQNVLSLLR